MHTEDVECAYTFRNIIRLYEIYFDNTYVGTKTKPNFFDS